MPGTATLLLEQLAAAGDATLHMGPVQGALQRGRSATGKSIKSSFGVEPLPDRDKGDVHYIVDPAMLDVDP